MIADKKMVWFYLGLVYSQTLKPAPVKRVLNRIFPGSLGMM
ncbi:MAG: hypothetical protein V3V73_05365 [Gammaproteobacteria bacterium]